MIFIRNKFNKKNMLNEKSLGINKYFDKENT